MKTILGIFIAIFSLSVIGTAVAQQDLSVKPILYTQGYKMKVMVQRQVGHIRTMNNEDIYRFGAQDTGVLIFNITKNNGDKVCKISMFANKNSTQPTINYEYTSGLFGAPTCASTFTIKHNNTISYLFTVRPYHI